MRLSYIASEAADSLAANLRRALLAALGIFVGVASVVCVIAAGKGLEGIIVKEMGPFGRPTTLMVIPNYRHLASTGWTRRPEALTAEDRAGIEALTDLIVGVSPIQDFQFTVRRGGRRRVARLLCVSSDYFPMERLSLDRGRVFNPEDDRALRRAAVLGAGIAEKLFGEPLSYDSEDPIGRRIEVGNFGEVEVVGILKEEPPSLMQAIESYDNTNNGTIFVPFSAIGRFGGPPTFYELRLEAASEAVVETAERAVLSLLAQKHGLWDGEPKYRIETGKNALSEISNMTGIVTTFISAVAGISLIVAGIGVMNVMLISVKERTREIGTRKALGARGSWIGSQFLIESLAVCLSGGVAGILLATTAAVLTARYTAWPALVPPYALPLSLVLCTLVALVFGWLPARRASKMDPCEALRYE